MQSHLIWANYNDLSRGHPKWWFSKGNPLISGKSRLVKYYNLPRSHYRLAIILDFVFQVILYGLYHGKSSLNYHLDNSFFTFSKHL